MSETPLKKAQFPLETPYRARVDYLTAALTALAGGFGLVYIKRHAMTGEIAALDLDRLATDAGALAVRMEAELDMRSAAQVGKGGVL